MSLHKTSKRTDTETETLSGRVVGIARQNKPVRVVSTGWTLQPDKIGPLGHYRPPIRELSSTMSGSNTATSPSCCRTAPPSRRTSCCTPSPRPSSRGSSGRWQAGGPPGRAAGRPAGGRGLASGLKNPDTSDTSDTADTAVKMMAKIPMGGGAGQHGAGQVGEGGEEGRGI